MRKPLSHVFLLCVVGAAPACDRCFGTTACTSAPVVSYAADVALGPGKDVGAGILIEMIGRDGFAADSMHAQATTDASGRAVFSVEGATAQYVLVDLLFHLPEPFNTVYRARNVAIETTRVENDIRFQDWWFDRPFIRHNGGVYYQPGVPRWAGDVEVEFTRTGGIELARNVMRSTTNEFGDFLLVSQAETGGTVVGDLLLTPPAPYEPRLVEGVELTAVLSRGEIVVIDDYGLGNVVRYGGTVYADDGVTPVDSATVVFERIGGIPVTPSRFETATSGEGEFEFTVVPDGNQAGTVIGRLEIQPPAPFLPVVVDSLALESFDEADDRAIDLGSWTLVRGS